MKRSLLLGLFCLGISSALADDNYQRTWVTRYTTDEKELAAKFIDAVGTVSSINSASAIALLKRIQDAGLIGSDVNVTWRLIDLDLAQSVLTTTPSARIRFEQRYRGLPVYGGHVRVDLERPSKKKDWVFDAVGATVGNINTGIPHCLPPEEILKRAQKYITDNYVEASPNNRVLKFINGSPGHAESRPQLAIRWMLDRNDESWVLAYETVHSYYIELENDYPLPIGLEFNASTGELMFEFPRAQVGCFGAAPEPKKPKK